MTADAKTWVDWGFRAASLLVLPLGAWIWNAEGRIREVEHREADIATLKAQMVQVQDDRTQIAVLQTDLRHINEALSDIKNLLERERRDR